MLVGYVIVSALLTLGFGVVVMLRPTAASHSWVFDVGLVLSALAFLLCFVRLLVIQAGADVQSRR